MQYAFVNGIKMLPKKGLEGICPCCNQDVTAKCGNIKIHHWAHKNLKDCDSWHEPETDWHRNWKNQFPKAYQEIPFQGELEIHRADIHTERGVTIEFQNSPISLDEVRSREIFYKQLIWVVNADKFRNNIEFLCNIPNPEHPLLMNVGIYYPQSKYSPKNSVKNILLIGMSNSYDKKIEEDRVYHLEHDEMKEIAKLFLNSSLVFWMINWKYKHKAWLFTKAPVFFDFGDDFLYWLKYREQRDDMLYYVHIIKKKHFIDKYSQPSCEGKAQNRIVDK